MKQHPVVSGPVLALLAVSQPALAVAQTAGTAASVDRNGKLLTLPRGSYLCTLPGNAEGLAMIPVPEAHFKITNGSSYSHSDGKGTYLLTGTYMRFTSGPLDGRRFEQTASNTVRALDENDQPLAMLCTRFDDGSN
ncbi:MAG: hypothetical protein ACK5NN_10505 [Sphingomonadaceae bacterium]